MSQRLLCPQCGNTEIQITTSTNLQTTGKNYSAAKGCCGWIALGPIGLLCGTCGKGQQTTSTTTTAWACPKCGKIFRDPENIKVDIAEAEKRNTAGLIACICGAIIMFFVFHAAFEQQLPLVSVALSLFFGIFLYIIARLTVKKQIDELYAELYYTEEGMKRRRRELSD